MKSLQGLFLKSGRIRAAVLHCPGKTATPRGVDGCVYVGQAT